MVNKLFFKHTDPFFFQNFQDVKGLYSMLDTICEIKSLLSDEKILD